MFFVDVVVVIVIVVIVVVVIIVIVVVVVALFTCSTTKILNLAFWYLRKGMRLLRRILR